MRPYGILFLVLIGAALLILACSEEIVDPPPPPPKESPWTKHENNPVFAASATGFDAFKVNYPSLFFDGTTNQMWYAGLTGLPSASASIGLATSSDGINWTKHNNNPVLVGGAYGTWDTSYVSTPVVIKDGAIYKMWYTGTDWWNEGRGFEIGLRFVGIGYATSPDGITWTRYDGNPVLTASSGDWDDISVIPCEVIFDGTVYKMWYAGGNPTESQQIDPTESQQIGYATSIDGITWTKFPGNPVFRPGASDSWDNNSVSTANIVFDGTTYHMWYMGSRTATIPYPSTAPRIGYATSNNGINWTRHSENPVLSVGQSGAWDDVWVGHPRVIFDGTTYHMWYAGYDGQRVRIGYASSTEPF